MLAVNAQEYMKYMESAAGIIRANQKYITELDAATGDGDHWANLSNGFEKLLEKKEELSGLSLGDCFRQIGMTMMSGVGGSSGVLYGSAYLAAAKELNGADIADLGKLVQCFETMAEAMMQRGQSKPGYKTMIDALYPAVQAGKQAVAAKLPEDEVLSCMEKAAYEGAESTKMMKAVRGRACYQPDKGVGHIDPGAMTMYYQIFALSSYFRSI